MTGQLNFPALLPYWPELLSGLWVTIQLTVLATVGGVSIGIIGAALRSGKPSWLSRLWGIYVELIRNTPFVVQLFFIVFGLPNLGLKLTAGKPHCWRCWLTWVPIARKLSGRAFRSRQKGSGKPVGCWD